VAVAGESRRGMVGLIDLAAALRPGESWTILGWVVRGDDIVRDNKGHIPTV
jgi:hypothetical protein